MQSARDARAQTLTGALERAAATLSAAQRVWLGTHADPDGDAIGSVLGLGWVLSDLGKDVSLACQDDPPAEVAFLPGSDQVRSLPMAAHDAAVALDAADAERLGGVFDAALWESMSTIVLDHHVSNPGYGDINVVDPTVASTAEIVVALADQMRAPISQAAAMCLLAGIVTDTMGFRTTNTGPKTLDCARRLTGLGASLPEVTQQVFFNRPLAHLHLIGRAISRLRIDGAFAVATLRQADFAEFGAPPEAVRGVSSLLATAAELAAVALVRERQDGSIDVSLRSKAGVDLVPAAVALGGGGHPQAAGARLEGPLAAIADAVMAALHAHVELPASEVSR